MYVLNLVISFCGTFLFAAIFKILPDADVSWKDVGSGRRSRRCCSRQAGCCSTVSWQERRPIVRCRRFGRGDLLWVYYTGIIPFIGAEFTQVWTRRKGKVIEPKRGAVVVETEVKYGGRPPSGG